jgi:hypothetical protein
MTPQLHGLATPEQVAELKEKHGNVQLLRVALNRAGDFYLLSKPIPEAIKEAPEVAHVYVREPSWPEMVATFKSASATNKHDAMRGLAAQIAVNVIHPALLPDKMGNVANRRAALAFLSLIEEIFEPAVGESLPQ